MINKYLPEPPVEHRQCNSCSKRTRLKGTLIHFPNENCTVDEVTLINGQKCGTFSFWHYECAWCRAIKTKRKIKEANYKIEHTHAWMDEEPVRLFTHAHRKGDIPHGHHGAKYWGLGKRYVP